MIRIFIPSNNVELNMDHDKDNELMLVKACEDYEKSVSVSNVHLDGIFQGASLENVTINISINK